VFGGADTTAGDITIDPHFIVLDGGHIVAQAKEGRGGSIRITVDHLFVSPDSEISASAGPAGINGTVVISTPEVDLSGGLVVLEGAFLDAASLLRARCAARRNIGASSFTGVGRGGLPPGPDTPLAGGYPGVTATVAAAAPTVAAATSSGGAVATTPTPPCRPWN
jgi:large exoprotein involved in heme utilization and adhesion